MNKTRDTTPFGRIYWVISLLKSTYHASQNYWYLFYSNLPKPEGSETVAKRL